MIGWEPTQRAVIQLVIIIIIIMEGRHVTPKKKTKLWEEVKSGGGTPHGSHHCGCIPPLHCELLSQ